MLNFSFERLVKSAVAKCRKPPELESTICPGFAFAAASRSLTELTGNAGPTASTRKLVPIFETNASAVGGS